MENISYGMLTVLGIVIFILWQILEQLKIIVYKMENLHKTLFVSDQFNKSFSEGLGDCINKLDMRLSDIHKDLQ